MQIALRQAIDKATSEFCVADKPPVIHWPKYICQSCGEIFESKVKYEEHTIPF